MCVHVFHVLPPALPPALSVTFSHSHPLQTLIHPLTHSPTDQARIEQMRLEEQDKARFAEELSELTTIIEGAVGQWGNELDFDLRRMLSNLHQIFPIGEGEFSCGRESTKSDVKRKYMKLQQRIHPDKLTQDTVERQICGKALFTILRASYEQFMELED
jgi:hypothetical protein